MTDFRSPVVPGLPRFTGGAVGYLGYSSASWFEPVLGDLGQGPDGTDPAGFMLFDTILAFDHVRHRILIIANARIVGGDDLESLYQFACAKVQFLERELERHLSTASAPVGRPLSWSSNLTRERFEQHVLTAKEHIAAGDIYQVVLSQRFEATVDADPLTVYRALRHVNPSPYMYFIRMGATSVVGSSPEMLVRVEGSRVETHPIAGTRPRGRSEEDDLRLAEELKRNEKERAEHVMLVDLGRNDVGRVCEYGSVRVPQFMGLERFSHVMHLTSIVQGRLSDEHDRLDALVSCFPAGTVSGAPKIRAMELIRSLETEPRGVYCGAIGQISPGGEALFNVAIRTAVVDRNGQGEMGIGSGIVADSQGSKEYAECLLKMKFLTDPPKRFELIETLLHDGKNGYWLLERHIERLKATAQYFNFAWNESGVRKALAREAEDRASKRLRVRLLLAGDGRITMASTPLPLRRG